MLMLMLVCEVLSGLYKILWEDFTAIQITQDSSLLLTQTDSLW